MHPTNIRNLIIACMLGLLASPVLASDIAKEQRWADQVVDSILVGQAEWLRADDHEFLGIYAEPTTDKGVGGVILLHGVGAHPNWTDVILPLRTQLPERGWYTLSLQMPILPNDAEVKDYAPLFEEIAPRVDAGIAFLKSKGVTNIVLIGHSMGATMASYFVANNDAPEIKALVMVGATGVLFKDPERDVVQSLKKIKKPVLDLSGSDDNPQVLETQALKAEAAKASGNSGYEEIRVADANHFFVGKEDELVENVGNWIGQCGER